MKRADCLSLAAIHEHCLSALDRAEWERQNPAPQDWNGWIRYRWENLLTPSSFFHVILAKKAFNVLPEDCKEHLYRRMALLDLSPRRRELHAFDDLGRVASAIEGFAREVFDSLERGQLKIAREKIAQKSAERGLPEGQRAKRRRMDVDCDSKVLLEALGELPSYRDRILKAVDAWVVMAESDGRIRRRIEAFLDDRELKELNLTGLNLETLPDIFHFPPFSEKLVNLNLDTNCFEALPPTLRHLKSLEWLSLQNNQLDTLPPWIGDFSALGLLNLSNNLLQSLPSSFWRLTHLFYVNLNDNSFTGFPRELCELPELCTVILKNNADLTSLPEEIFLLSDSCEIDLWDCGLSSRVIQAMRATTEASGYLGPQIFFSSEDGIPYQDFPVEESLDLLYSIIGIEAARFPALVDEKISEGHLRRWLSRLIDMADFKNGGRSKRGLAENIVAYLELAQEDPQFRTIFFSIIKKAAQTCGDKMSLSIVYLGLAHKMATFNRRQIKAFSNFLLRGVFAVDLLDRLARERIEREKKTRLRYVDEIEVYLGYPVMLKKKLALPIDVEGMLFFKTSTLTQEDLDIAERLVKEKLSDRAACCRFLIEQPEWKEALKAKYPQDYADVEKKGRCAPR